jgi:Zn ribbon nucleic-acid-binding protein
VKNDEIESDFDVTVLRSRPVAEVPCPKCGSDGGWSSAKYRWWRCREWLEFDCLMCGYGRQEPTKDAVPPLPTVPPNRVVYEGWTWPWKRKRSDV